MYVCHRPSLSLGVSVAPIWKMPLVLAGSGDRVQRRWRKKLGWGVAIGAAAETKFSPALHGATRHGPARHASADTRVVESMACRPNDRLLPSSPPFRVYLFGRLTNQSRTLPGFRQVCVALKLNMDIIVRIGDESNAHPTGNQRDPPAVETQHF